MFNLYLLKKHIFNLTILPFLFFFNLNSPTTLFVNHFLLEKLTNSKLTNGLLIIHPFLIYYYYILIFLLCLVKPKKITNILNNQFFFLKLFKIALSALFLGGWWASQELNWGGWWNWDFIEIITLIFLIKFILFLHNNHFYLFFFKNQFLFYLLLFFIYVRWDVITSVHSFNSTTFSTIYNVIILTIVFFVFLVYWFNISKVLLILNQYTKKTKNTIVSIMTIVVNSTNILLVNMLFYNTYLILLYEKEFTDYLFFINVWLNWAMTVAITVFIKLLTNINLYFLFFNNYVMFTKTLIVLSFFFFFKKKKKIISLMHFFFFILIILTFFSKSLFFFEKAHLYFFFFNFNINDVYYQQFYFFNKNKMSMMFENINIINKKNFFFLDSILFFKVDFYNVAMIYSQNFNNYCFILFFSNFVLIFFFWFLILLFLKKKKFLVFNKTKTKNTLIIAKYKKKSNEGFIKTMQKNRFFKKPKNQNLIFGSVGLKFIQEGFLEFRHVIKFKRLIKKIIKKSKRKLGRKWRMMARKKKKKATSLKAKSFLKKLKEFKRKKLKLKKRFFWWHLFPNFLLTKKSTNARMGKGKGSPKRWLFRVNGGLFFIKFLGHDFTKLYKHFFKFNLRSPVRFFFVFFQKKFKHLSATNNLQSTTYYTKKRFF